MVIRVDGAPRDYVARIKAVARSEGSGLRPDVQLLADVFGEKLNEPRQVATIAAPDQDGSAQALLRPRRIHSQAKPVSILGKRQNRVGRFVYLTS